MHLFTFGYDLATMTARSGSRKTGTGARRRSHLLWEHDVM
jgi:hypothetical protein